jgi:hypothetical protein
MGKSLRVQTVYLTRIDVIAKYGYIPDPALGDMIPIVVLRESIGQLHEDMKQIEREANDDAS